MNKSEENLLGFYRAIGETKLVKWIQTDKFEAISEYSGNWPQLVYRFCFENDYEKNMGRVLSDLTGENSRMLALCSAAVFTKFDVDKLREASVFPIEIWETMELEILPDLKKMSPENYEIKPLTNHSAITEFSNLVNTDMMRTLKLPEMLFATLAINPKFEFFGVYAEDMIVSGLIVFTENRTSGLYFIVTKASYRGKRLAENLIFKTLQQLFEKGTESVVLQAVNKAVPLYARIGFKTKEKLVILMNN